MKLLSLVGGCCILFVAEAFSPSISPTVLGGWHKRQQQETTYLCSTTNNDLPTTTTSSSDVEFPPPLTSIQRTKRAIEFYKRVLPVLAAYKAKELELQLFPDKFSKDDVDGIWKELDEWGSTKIAETIKDMKGFYVKTGQVISTRVDLFPEAYTSKLQELQDGLDPMPFSLVEKVVSQELLDGAPLSDLFASFDEQPLGAASIAQVHKATLLDGRTVAVKLQRPNVEPKLLGDVANLKRISKALAKSLPVDYYTVFCELGDALERELDFLSEAQAMRKLHMTLQDSPVQIPLPIGELVSKRVLVMDFMDGIPLNQLGEQMRKTKGIEPGSIEAKFAGREILQQLADAFGRMIFHQGAIHGDPHPGNIFISTSSNNEIGVSLIDCGQFKTLPRPQRVLLAQLVLVATQYQTQRRLVSNSNDSSLIDIKAKLANCVRDFGVKFTTTSTEEEEDDDDLACAVALFLFGDSDLDLPGGYSNNEFSENSPIRFIADFPQELVLLGRASVLMKGIAKRLNVTFSLGDGWNDHCHYALQDTPTLPIWSTSTTSMNETNQKIKFQQIQTLLKEWSKGKGKRFLQRIIQRLPSKLRTRIVQYILQRKEQNKRTTPSIF